MLWNHARDSIRNNVWNNTCIKPWSVPEDCFLRLHAPGRIFCLIPPHHGQFIVYTLAHQYLMKVNDSIVECCRAGAQIQIPHADKFLVEHVLYLLFMFLEIPFPAQQCLVVMVSQVLHIQNMKVMFRHQGYNFPETWNDPARKYIFLYPWIPCVLFLAADKMEQEYAARIQHLVHTVHEPAVIFPSHMLHHTHADHTVKFHTALG